MYAATRPTIAFTARDLRSPGFGVATRVARKMGFETVVRSPGGRMVAYDEGAVVIDHVTATTGGPPSGSVFAENAASHLHVLRRLGLADARIGEVDGEYCPGEFGINVGGVAKVIGSAQRITGRASLFSTVVQVALSDRVRRALTQVSAALSYPLASSTVAGLRDFAPGLTTAAVMDALVEDYRSQHELVARPLPDGLLAHAAGVLTAVQDHPFRVDDWARAHPLN